jgi:pimeloyl-ACP methyl ester carboxylesterase
VSWLLRHRFDSAQRAPRISAPLLCIAAGEDRVIPVEHARRLYEAWGGPKRWIEIENAGHNSTDGAPVFWQSIIAFLEKSV